MNTRIITNLLADLTYSRETKQAGLLTLIVSCVLLHLRAKLQGRSKKEKEGQARIGEYVSLHHTVSCVVTKALTVAERVAFAARRVPPSYLRSGRDVPTRWRGRNYGCCVVVPPERHDEAMSLIRGQAKMTVGVE